MATETLTHQMKSLDNACRQLQSRMGNDPAAAELLYCARTLLTRLTLQGAIGPTLTATARETFARLTGAAAPDDLFAALDDRLAHLPDTPEGTTLGHALLRIEADYTAAFEQAFRAALAETAQAESANPAAGYDKQALAKFLADKLATPDLAVTAIDMISGGFSKQTLKATLTVPPQALVLRADLPKGKAFTGTSVADEFPILQTLYQRGVTVPRPYAVEPTGAVIGCPFVALAAAAGKTLGTLFEFPAPIPEIGRQMAQQLARIHAVPEDVIGPNLTGPQPPNVARTSAEIDKSYQDWRALGRTSAVIEAGFRYLRKHAARAAGARRLVHGDFGLHNFLVADNRITAVLDWEFAKLGNPADDLGYAYDTIDHMLGWNEFAKEYEAAGGTLPSRAEIDFFRLLGLVRITVYCHQADAGFVAGALPGIQYALPGNLYLRGVVVRVARLLEQIA